MFNRLFSSYDKRNALKSEQAAQNREISTADHKAASWRNGIGWVCVFGMAYQLILRDLLIWGAKSGYYVLSNEPPSLDGRLWSLVFGMLGIAIFDIDKVYLIGYICLYKEFFMFEVKTTLIFNKWLSKIKDAKARVKIDKRIERLKLGNFGDVKSVGDGVSELRIDYGQGYRIYYTKQGKMIVILLCGGDKSTQEKDIKKAKEMLKC